MENGSLFHYTYAHKIEAILADGYLKPSGQVEKERKVLWFSRRSDYEPTAVKMWLQDGQLERPTFEQLAAKVTPIRFRLLVSPESVGLLPWVSVCRAAGIPQRSLEFMVKAGVKIGASPADWFGALSSILLTDLQSEAYLSGKWVLVAPDGLVKIARSQLRILSANPKDVGMKVA